MKASFYDELTNLYNRLAFHERLAQALALAKRRGESVAIHFIDIDDFKTVNDTLGHAAGDIVLQGVGKRLLATVREVDTVARIGGDEFVVLQPEVKEERDADVLGKRLIAAFEAPFSYENHPLKVHVSIGIALSRGETTDVTELLKRADMALYDAKRRGKNQLSFETPPHG